MRSLVQVPPAVARAFYAQIPGSTPSTTIEGSYIIPCSTPFSSLALVFGGVRYEIPRRDLLRAISSDGRQCVLTIAESQSEDVDGTPMAIVGDVLYVALVLSIPLGASLGRRARRGAAKRGSGFR